MRSPTTIYAALLDHRYSGRIHKSDLVSANPYNTYENAGLAAGFRSRIRERKSLAGGAGTGGNTSVSCTLSPSREEEVTSFSATMAEAREGP